MPKQVAFFLLQVLLCFQLFLPPGLGWAEDALPTVPAPGMVTLANFGARNCIPCRMMAPIREELRQEYKGRAAILFVDVHRHYEQIDLFAIQLIPTLIFYDKDGNEMKRHIGFMDKKTIQAELAKLGVK